MKRNRRRYPTIEQVSDVLIAKNLIDEPFKTGKMVKNWKGFKCREITGPANAETYGRKTFAYINVSNRKAAIAELNYNNFPVTTSYGKGTRRIEVRVKTFKAENWWE